MNTPEGTVRRRSTALLLALILLLQIACSLFTVPRARPAATQSASLTPAPAAVTVTPEGAGTVAPGSSDAPGPTSSPAAQETPTGTPAATQPSVESMPAQPPTGVSGGDSIGDSFIPELGNTGYDVQRYRLALDVDMAQKQLSATVEISATATLAELGRLSLDFIGYTVEDLEVDGQPARFYRSPNKLYVDLPAPLAQGANFLMRVRYSGEIRPYSSPYFPLNEILLGLQVVGPKHALAFSEPDGARAWFPCNDHPLDRASFQVEATVPTGLVAVSNGLLADTRPAGEKTTYTWVMDAPMATYLLALAIGDYRRIDGGASNGVALRHYIFSKISQPQVLKNLAQSADILKFLSERLTPYPYSSFGFVEVTQKGLAMETTTMILADAGLLDDIPANATAMMAHEAAHHWFGDSVGLATWSDVWLNEGFATYLEQLWDARQGGQGHDWLDQTEKFLIRRNQPLGRPLQRDLFGGITYFKGAWVLYMLRQEIGDEAFFETLKEYAKRYANHSATTADFQAVAEEVSRRSLETFFKQWVFAPDHPELQVTWRAQPYGEPSGGGSQVQVQVCQAQQPDTFSVPLDLGFDDPQGGADQVQTLQIDARQTRLEVTLPYSPTAVIPDPDQRLLAATSTRQVRELEPCK